MTTGGGSAAPARRTTVTATRPPGPPGMARSSIVADARATAPACAWSSTARAPRGARVWSGGPPPAAKASARARAARSSTTAGRSGGIMRGGCMGNSVFWAADAAIARRTHWIGALAMGWLPRRRGLLEPVLEARLGEPGAGVRHEGALAQEGAVVPRAGVGDHLARIVTRAEGAADQVVEAELLGAGDLDDAVHRRAHGDRRHRPGDVVRRHRLDEHRRQAHRGAVGGGVGDALDELEELRRVHDRVRDRGPRDQRLLRDLGAEVAALGQALGPPDRP